MNKIVNSLEKLLFNSIVFLLPSQFSLHFWPEFSYVFGIRVDYLSPTIYLTDLLIFFVILLWFFRIDNGLLMLLKKYRFLVLLFFLFVFFNIFNSSSVLLTSYKWIKICEYIFFGLYIFYRRAGFLSRKTVAVYFASSIAFSLIGISQFWLGHTTGLFYILGERSFGMDTPGIALFSFFGREMMRAYSTFSHPNSLAGYLGIVLIIFSNRFISSLKNIFRDKSSNYYYNVLGYLIILVAFLLTASLSSFVSISVVLILRFFFKKTSYLLVKIFLLISFILSLVTSIYSSLLINSFKFSTDILERLRLIYVSGKMVSLHFWTGVGLGEFIPNSVKFSGLHSIVWILQPVHNIYMLIFSETGIFGFIFFFIFLMYLLKRVSSNQKILYVFMFIFVTGLADHYWLTLQQNILVFVFVITFFGLKHSKKGKLLSQ